MSVTEDKGSQIDACLESYDVISLSSGTDSRRSSGIATQASPRPRRARGRMRAFSSVVHRATSTSSVDFGTSSQRHAGGLILGRR